MDIKSPSIQMVERLWVGSGWAAGNGPKAGQWAQGPFLGLPKAGHKLDMCLILVQNQSINGRLCYTYTGLEFRLPPEIAADQRRFPPATET